MTNMFSTMTISTHGMRAQGERVRVIAQNLANADTAPLKPGDDPYVRQVITFKNEMDKASGEKLVQVDEVKKVDKEQFITKYMPDHPAADDQGYVKMPNVNMLMR